MAVSPRDPMVGNLNPPIPALQPDTFNLQADMDGSVPAQFGAAESTSSARLADCPGYMESAQGYGQIDIPEGVPVPDWNTDMGY